MFRIVNHFEASYISELTIVVLTCKFIVKFVANYVEGINALLNVRAELLRNEFSSRRARAALQANNFAGIRYKNNSWKSFKNISKYILRETMLRVIAKLLWLYRCFIARVLLITYLNRIGCISNFMTFASRRFLEKRNFNNPVEQDVPNEIYSLKF